jgi:hypothetical protein
MKGSLDILPEWMIISVANLEVVAFTFFHHQATELDEYRYFDYDLLHAHFSKFLDPPLK